MIEVFLGLGSNLGDSISLVKEALERISSLSGIYDVKSSRLYKTSPVSAQPQPFFINAVCSFKTILSLEDLHQSLLKIEQALGKIPKAKDAPRLIDIDILFYGNTFHRTSTLCIPHPRWKERLFVLLPLLDLCKEMTYPVSRCEQQTILLEDFLKSFKNIHRERVIPLE